MSVGSPIVLAVALGDGTAVTAAGRTSLTAGALSSSSRITLPPNTLKTKDVINLKATGRISSVITTPGTARFDLAFGTSLGTAVMDSQAIALDPAIAHTNAGWILDMWGTVRVEGNAANIFWQGTWSCEDIVGVSAGAVPRAIAAAMLPYGVAPSVGANFDNTVLQPIDLNFTQTLATGSCQLHQYILTLFTATGF